MGYGEMGQEVNRSEAAVLFSKPVSSHLSRREALKLGGRPTKVRLFCSHSGLETLAGERGCGTEPRDGLENKLGFLGRSYHAASVLRQLIRGSGITVVC